MMPGRLLVKQKKVNEINGIYLPEEQSSPYGRVVSIGGTLTLDNGKKLIPPVKVGDWVMFKEIGDVYLEIDGEEYVHLTFPDLLLVINE